MTADRLHVIFFSMIAHILGDVWNRRVDNSDILVAFDEDSQHLQRVPQYQLSHPNQARAFIVSPPGRDLYWASTTDGSGPLTCWNVLAAACMVVVESIEC